MLYAPIQRLNRSVESTRHEYQDSDAQHHTGSFEPVNNVDLYALDSRRGRSDGSDERHPFITQRVDVQSGKSVHSVKYSFM